MIDKKVIIRERLFKDHTRNMTVYLIIWKDTQPYIQVESDRPLMEFSLSSYMKIVANITKIDQVIGDGPHWNVMPEEYAERILEESLSRIKPDQGHFEITWIPGGDPF